MAAQARIERNARPGRRRRRLTTWLVVLVVVIALFVAADFAARAYATGYIRQQVATALGLPSDDPVKVDLGPGSVILQAVGGHIGEVRVGVDRLTLGDLSGSAVLTAHDVPLSTTQPVGSLDLRVTVPAATITKAIAHVPALSSLHPTATVVGATIRSAGATSLFGIRIPVSAIVKPGVKDGVPTFDVQSLTASGATISAATLDKYAPALGKLLRSGSSLCIADSLPKAFSLSAVALRHGSLVYTFSAHDVELNPSALSQKGSCPAS